MLTCDEPVKSWENWDLGSALYFCFITLTTIGFGDLWPRYSFLHYMDGVGAFMKMIVTIVYSIFGKKLSNARHNWGWLIKVFHCSVLVKPGQDF